MDGVEPVLYPILRGDFISQGKRLPLVIFSREGGVKLGVQYLAFFTVCAVAGSVKEVGGSFLEVWKCLSPFSFHLS